jgi:hypothetical protein
LSSNFSAPVISPNPSAASSYSKYILCAKSGLHHALTLEARARHVRIPFSALSSLFLADFPTNSKICVLPSWMLDLRLCGRMAPNLEPCAARAQGSHGVIRCTKSLLRPTFPGLILSFSVPRCLDLPAVGMLTSRLWRGIYGWLADV